MTVERQNQSNVPAVLGRGMAITIDGTSRQYDLGALGWNGLEPLADDPSLDGCVFLALHADTACCYAFSDAAGGTVALAANMAAGAAAAFGANAGQLLAANVESRVRWYRKNHRYLYLIGTAGILRIFPSSFVNREKF